MVREVLSLPAAMIVGDAIKDIQRRSDELEMVFYLYVVNEHDHLVGVCSLRELVISPPEVQLADIMTTDVVRVTTDTDQEEVARIVARYNLLAVPVVDTSNRLVGLITVDDIIDVIREEATEDILKMAGVGEEDISERRSVWESARSRAPWLLASFVGGVLVTFIIGGQQSVIEQVAALAAFIPIILGMGGNVGTQSLTIVTRGLALNRIDLARLWRVVGREAFVGLLCGLAYGLILGVVVALKHHDHEAPIRLAATISLSIVTSMTLAALLGGAVPLIFRRLAIDPAVASGPFVTTTVDMIGSLTYFAIARILLGL
jgi:magnesium transporter